MLSLSSYYITQIEYKLTKLGLSLDEPSYNQIFAYKDVGQSDEEESKIFVRRLRKYNAWLNNELDKIEMDGQD